jgi:hypothetical protein
MDSIFMSPVAAVIPFDNSTNGFVSTDTQSAIEESRKTTLNYSATATTNTTSSSGTDSVISGMTITPPAGTYLVIYSGQIGTSGTNNSGEISLYNDGTRIAHSVRDVSINVALLLGVIGTSTMTIGGNQTMAITTVDGSTAITAQFKVLGGSGTLTIGPRSIIALRIG